MGAEDRRLHQEGEAGRRKICTIEGNAAADNILRRAQGMRDALTGQKGLAALRRRRLDRSLGLPGLHQ